MVSIVVLPSIPLTVPSPSAIAPDGSATTTTSASEASPPSRPSAWTSCPAACQRFASPPPTFPRPTTVIFTVCSLSVVVALATIVLPRHGAPRAERRARQNSLVDRPADPVYDQLHRDRAEQQSEDARE